MKSERKKKQKRMSKILSILFLLIIIVLFVMLFMFELVPKLYVLIALIIMLLIYLVILKLNFSRKKPKRVLGYIFTFILSAFFVTVEVYLGNTLDLFNSIKASGTKIETYNVIVLKDSKYEELKDLNNKSIGVKEIHNNSGLQKAKKHISKKIDIKYKEYDDISEVALSLTQEKNEAIILENGELSIFAEENPEIYEEMKIIYSFEVKVKVKDVSKDVDITKKPFNIYISGVDTFGKINSATRSDVNMVMSVNPVTDKIHLTWIPRDYYVHINTSTYKDKLTHAGIYGIDSSIYAVETLLQTDINYYVKVNFTSVIKIVDVLGGINVYNDESFTSQDGYYYKKGDITLNGEKALSFVRERKNVSGGDLTRGKNQIKVLEALMNKVMSPKILLKYNSIINSLDGSFVTNMDMSDITKFVERNLKDSNFEITNYNLTGKDGYDYTYSYKKSKLYVMRQDEESVSIAQDKIKEALSVEN